MLKADFASLVAGIIVLENTVYKQASLKCLKKPADVPLMQKEKKQKKNDPGNRTTLENRCP